MNLRDHPEARGLLGHSWDLPGGKREASEQKCTKGEESTQVHEVSVFHILDNILECLWPHGSHCTINKGWSPFPVRDLRVSPNAGVFLCG